MGFSNLTITHFVIPHFSLKTALELTRTSEITRVGIFCIFVFFTQFLFDFFFSQTACAFHHIRGHLK